MRPGNLKPRLTTARLTAQTDATSTATLQTTPTNLMSMQPSASTQNRITAKKQANLNIRHGGIQPSRVPGLVRLGLPEQAQATVHQTELTAASTTATRTTP